MAYIKYDGALAALTSASTSSFFSTDAAETLRGAAGGDEFWGGSNDTLIGGAGDDSYFLNGTGISVVEAVGGGADRLVAWQSVNLARYSNIENAKVSGDNVYAAGDTGANVIEGGDGAQQIYGGGGQDVLIGGAGRDTFIVVKGEGSDVIQDFSVADDVIRLKAGFDSFAEVKAAMTQQGADVHISFGAEEGLILRGVSLSQLSARNFALELDRSTLGQTTFNEDFTGKLSLWDPESNPTGVWRPDYGYQGTQGMGSYVLANNGEKQIYTSPYFRDHAGDFAETPFVSNPDGTLSIWAKPSTNSEIFDFNYTSGLITTKPSFTQTYGYFEMRADIPEVAGAWPAFWLLPADGTWPPELDVMETLGGDPWATWTTRHTSAEGHHDAKGLESFVPATADGMHTYGLLWTQSDLVWYVDNVEVFRTTTPGDMHKPMFMLANLAMGGWAGGVPAGTTAEFKIDYIRAYGVPGSTTETPTQTPGGGAGGSGDPTPPPASSEPGLVLTSDQYADVLTGGAGADTLQAGQGPDQLTGGAGADVFVFRDLPWNAGHVTDFKVGVDKLDLGALLSAAGVTSADPIASGHVILVADGLGGTKVYFDPDAAGAVHRWPTLVTTLDGVAPGGLTAATLLKGSGGASQPQPQPGTPAGVSLVSDQYADTLVGGAGTDTLAAGQGPDVLTGGGAADHFVFSSLPWNAGHVTDFQAGVDKLDLSALFDQAGYQGSNPVQDGLLSFVADGAGGSKVYFDADGAGTTHRWPTLITTLDGVAPTTLTSHDWIV